MRDLYRRAVLAFPDEDVLVGARLARSRGLPRLRRSRRHRPPARPQSPPGEERAWGRRLAKRFGADGPAR